MALTLWHLEQNPDVLNPQFFEPPEWTQTKIAFPSVEHCNFTHDFSNYPVYWNHCVTRFNCGRLPVYCCMYRSAVQCSWGKKWSNMMLNRLGQIQDFSKGWGGWYLGVAESVGYVPKMFQFKNWDLIQNHFIRNTKNM